MKIAKNPPNGQIFFSEQSIKIKETFFYIKWIFGLAQERKLLYVVGLQQPYVPARSRLRTLLFAPTKVKEYTQKKHKLFTFYGVF